MTERTQDERTGSRLVTSRIRETPIAIVGMACLMPDARSLPEFWDNILRKVDSITDVPSDRWDAAQYYDPDPFARDKVYSKRGAFIPTVPFDPLAWGLPPNILHATDTNQLLSLVVAKDCLDDAGVTADSGFDRDRIGIVLGIGGGQKLALSLGSRLQYPLLEQVLKREGVSETKRAQIIERFKAQFPDWEENSFPGSLGNVVAGRIANRLNLGGLNTVTDAACASALSAVRIAVQELLEGHSDLMLAGAACTDNSIAMYMSFSKTPAFTRGQDSRPFDAESEGMLVGEGIGMIALKRLSDAEAAGDRIYAVLRGVGASSDGRFKSIYAPRPEGQLKALRRAYDDAGFDASTLGLIEAHGTGTPAGDVAETAALKMACGPREGQRPHIALGSVKSQIGHLKAAAGIAGLIKAVLALHQKVLPPTIHVDSPNPKLGLDDAALYLNTQTRPWIARADGVPRRAGVSAFGFGGTNFHVAIEEYTREPERAPAERGSRLFTPAFALLFSAPRVDALLSQLDAARAAFAACSGRPRFVELAHGHALRPIDAAEPRAAVVARTSEEAADLIGWLVATLRETPSVATLERKQKAWYRSAGADCRGRIAVVFPGQGSQFVNMGGQLALTFPEVRSAIEAMDAAASTLGVEPISRVSLPVPESAPDATARQDAELRATERAQPAIGAFSAGLYQVLRAAGCEPDFFAGHSFGELTALWAAGAFDFATFCRLAVVRGQAMKARPNEDAGAMIAVVGDVDALAPHLQRFARVSIANLNSPRQVVLGGPGDEIEACRAALSEAGYRVIPLPVSAAFHTELVQHAHAPLAQELAAASIQTPRGCVYANTTAAPYPAHADEVRALLSRQLLEPVRFRDQIEAMYAAGARVFIECGPKEVLSGLIGEILRGREHLCVALNGSPKQESDPQLRAALAQLATAGVALRDPDAHAAVWPATSTWKQSPMGIELSAPNRLSAQLSAARADCVSSPAAATEQSDTQSHGASMSKLNPETQSLVAVPSHSDLTTEDERPEYPMVPTVVNLASLESHALRTHDRYLESQRSYVDGMMFAVRRQFELLATAPESQLPKSLERSLESLNDYQRDALRVHASILGQQAEVARALFGAARHDRVVPAFSAAPFAVADSAAGPVASAVQLAAKPAVDVRPIVQVRAPSAAPRVAVAAPGPALVPAPAPSTAPEPERAQAPASSAGAASTLQFEQLQGLMLGVVGEKTGYPAEMLQPEMDMESDLGIDSIKRVEILGAIQERVPNLPEMDTAVLAELRTLADVIRYMEKVLSETGPDSMIALTNALVPQPETPEVASFLEGRTQGLPAMISSAVAQAALPPSETPAAPASGEQVQALQQMMLDVVAEKTGYVSSMLEPTMDMESDLGIDSIKRVEILGAVQERFPNLPPLDTAVLAELRTLAEVAEYFQKVLSGAPASAMAPAPETADALPEKKTRESIGLPAGAPA